jgi:hypothetical protein
MAAARRPARGGTRTPRRPASPAPRGMPGSRPARRDGMLDGAPASGHPETVEPPAVRPAQLQTLRRRRASIQRRLDELAVLPARPVARELALTRRRARESQLAGRRALLSYRDALYRSAQAHDSAAAAHQRAARSTGDAGHE